MAFKWVMLGMFGHLSCLVCAPAYNLSTKKIRNGQKAFGRSWLNDPWKPRPQKSV